MKGGEPRASSSSSASAVYTSLSFAVRARSILTLRRNSQVVSMENAHEHELQVLDHFQAHVAHRLLPLLTSPSHDKADADAGKADHPSRHHTPLITLSFLQRLLDAFLCIEEEFKAMLLVFLGRHPALVSRPPLDRLVADLLDRAVKSLDVCNALTHALDSLRFCQKQAEIAVAALRPPSAAAAPFLGLGEAQFHRARRASSKLLAFLVPERSETHRGATTERTWSFGRSSRGGATSYGSGGSGSAAAFGGYGRQCVALDVSQSWSAAKQMQAMWATLAPPRGADATALAMSVYTMSAVTVFVMWTLAVAFPCQERGGHGSSAIATAATSFPAPPRQLPWAAPMVALQEGIADEWRRRDRRGSSAPPGLLAELQSMLRCGQTLVDLGGGSPVFPLEERQREEMAGVCSELGATYRSMEEELGPLQQRVREVFHRVVLSRTEVLHCLSHGDRDSSTSSQVAV